MLGFSHMLKNIMPEFYRMGTLYKQCIFMVTSELQTTCLTYSQISKCFCMLSVDISLSFQESISFIPGVAFIFYTTLSECQH